MNRVFPAAAGFGVAVVGASRHGLHFHELLHEGVDILEQIHMLEHVGPAMPGQMDYRRPAFAPRVPEYAPPEPAKPGFTRSPTENDIIICPSCEEELVHKKDTEEPIVKKGGKTPTKKEREEHPFWVIKECGHVSGFLIVNCIFTNNRPGLLQQLLSESSSVE